MQEPLGRSTPSFVPQSEHAAQSQSWRESCTQAHHWYRGVMLSRDEPMRLQLLETKNYMSRVFNLANKWLNKDSYKRQAQNFHGFSESFRKIVPWTQWTRFHIYVQNPYEYEYSESQDLQTASKDYYFFDWHRVSGALFRLILRVHRPSARSFLQVHLD